MNTLAIIPCKSHSHRVPGKNTMVLGGVPNLTRTIRELQASRLEPDIIVVTDSHHAADLAQLEDVPAITEPGWMAQYGDLWDVIYYGIKYHPYTVEHELLALAYPNVPIRPPGMWDRLLDKLITTEADSARATNGQGNGGSLFDMGVALDICGNRNAVDRYDHVVLSYHADELLEIDTGGDLCRAKELLENRC